MQGYQLDHVLLQLLAGLCTPKRHLAVPAPANLREDKVGLGQGNKSRPVEGVLVLGSRLHGAPLSPGGMGISATSSVSGSGIRLITSSSCAGRDRTSTIRLFTAILN
ncbi:MAG: hypothetical protein A4E39_01229 [Methanoregulaceae archaeon PtaB.Bin152]|nr:MAG: hypothetical protein A4E39_01229 [Methanoregulaceae archaeon PtaB.Bin152]